MSVVIRKVLPEEVAELKVISEDTFRETFAHDNTEAQLQGYFDTALSEEVLLDEITHEEWRYFFILVDGEKAGFLKTNVGSAQTGHFGCGINQGRLKRAQSVSVTQKYY